MITRTGFGECIWPSEISKHVGTLRVLWIGLIGAVSLSEEGDEGVTHVYTCACTI